MDTFFTHGGIQTAVVVLLCSQVMTMLWACWLAARVRRLSTLVSRAMKRAQAPTAWESNLAEVRADLVSLSSSFEKVATAVTRQNSRDVMRARRSGPGASDGPPPPGAPKAELRRYYGLGRDGPEFATRQLSLVKE